MTRNTKLADNKPGTPERPAKKKKNTRSVLPASGLRRFMLPSLLAPVVLVLGLAVALHALHTAERERAAEQAAQALVDQPAAVLRLAIEQSDASLQALVASHAVREAVASSRSPEMISQQLSSLVAGGRVHVTLAGELPRNSLSFTARDLIQQARDGTPQMALLPGPAPQLLLARQTPDGRAIVLLEQDFSPVVAQLRRQDLLTGGIRVMQQGSQAPALQFGLPEGPERARAVTSGGLTLTYYGTPGGTLDPLLVPALLALGAVLVLLMLVQWLVLRAIDAAIAGDAAALRQHAQEAGRLGAGAGRRYRFTALEQVRDHMDAAASRQQAQRPASPPVQRAAAPADAFLDIVVEEGAPLLTRTNAPAVRSLPTEIFRANDIRGVVGKTLTAEMVELLGRAIGSQAGDVGQQTVLVARDGRTSSDELAKALIRGLTGSGRDVLDLGAVPSPVLHYALSVMDTQTGVVVTGSHNPSVYNGLKITIAGETVAGDALLALKARIEENRFSEGPGEVSARDISERYLRAVSDDIVLARPLKVVIDCGNGITGVIAPQLVAELGCEVVPLFADVDGHFPNHHPDPGRPENLHALAQAVAEQGADIGIAFDGDGARLGVVTPAGEIIWPDRLLMLYARDLLARSPGADILYDVKCSRELTKLISRMGGRPQMAPSGHARMKAALRATGATLAGELSGHFFFADRWHGVEDALYAAARLLEILALESANADAVFARLKTGLATPELLIPASDNDKFELVEKLLARQDTFSAGSINTLDGLRVEFEDGWGLVRASNTMPALSARFEGRDKPALQRIAGLFRTELQAIEPKLKLPF